MNAKNDELYQLDGCYVFLPPQVRLDRLEGTKDVIGVHYGVNQTVDNGKHGG